MNKARCKALGRKQWISSFLVFHWLHIANFILFFFEKFNCFPNPIQKVITDLPFNTLCKMVGWDHLFYFSLVLTPHCNFHFKKSGNLKRPQMQSNWSLHTPILCNKLTFRNFFQNLVSENSKIKFRIVWEPKFSIQKALLHTYTIFGIFFVYWCKNLQKIPILTILNWQFICPLFSADHIIY